MKSGKQSRRNKRMFVRTYVHMNGKTIDVYRYADGSTVEVPRA